MPLLLEPVIASFCRAYPEVELEIAASDELVDLAAGGFDAGIRLGQLISPDMVAVRLTPPFPFVVVGSPDYLERHGGPERVDDLRRHACLRLRRSNGAIAPWRFVDGNKADRGHRLRPADRARLPDAARRGDPGRGTQPAACVLFLARRSLNERRSITIRWWVPLPISSLPSFADTLK